MLSRSRILLRLFSALLCGAGSLLADDLAWLDSYNVAWTSPSKNSAESMPCGGGDTGMNVWVENGELLCYIQRSGCFDENNQYLKLGRIRLRLDPNPFADGSHVPPGTETPPRPRGDHREIRRPRHPPSVSGRMSSARSSTSRSRPTNRCKPPPPMKTGGSPILTCRTTRRRPRFACLGWDGYPGKVTRFRDEVKFLGSTVFFYHRNRDENLLFDYTVKQQGLAAVKDQLANTQKGRTFGGILRGEGFVAGRHCARHLSGHRASPPGNSVRNKRPRSHHIELVSHIAQTDTLDQWQAGLARDGQRQDPARRSAANNPANGGRSSGAAATSSSSRTSPMPTASRGASRATTSSSAISSAATPSATIPPSSMAATSPSIPRWWKSTAPSTPTGVPGAAEVSPPRTSASSTGRCSSPAMRNSSSRSSNTTAARCPAPSPA